MVLAMPVQTRLTVSTVNKQDNGKNSKNTLVGIVSVLLCSISQAQSQSGFNPLV